MISFEEALASFPEPSIDFKARHFVASLLAQATSGKISAITGTVHWSDKVILNNFASNTWQVPSRIASRTSPDHHAPDVLVRVVALLKESEDEPWKDLGGLGISMRDSWNRDPTFEIDTADGEREFSFDEWLNLNPFVARLFGVGVVRGFRNFAIWEMRIALLVFEGSRSRGSVGSSLKSRILPFLTQLGAKRLSDLVYESGLHESFTTYSGNIPETLDREEHRWGGASF